MSCLVTKISDELAKNVEQVQHGTAEPFYYLDFRHNDFRGHSGAMLFQVLGTYYREIAAIDCPPDKLAYVPTMLQTKIKGPATVALAGCQLDKDCLPSLDTFLIQADGLLSLNIANNSFDPVRETMNDRFESCSLS